MVDYLMNPRFHIFLYELFGGLLLVWIIAVCISLWRKSSWKNENRIEIGAYNAWIFAIWLHLLFILGFNSYQVYTWYLHLEETFDDFWVYAVTYLVGVIIDIILLLILHARKRSLKYR